jgi:hypothetical protein
LALEAPNALTGLSRETQVHVEEAYIKANHSAALTALIDQEEALDLLDAATKITTREIYSNVNMTETAFTSWFANRWRDRNAEGCLGGPAKGRAVECPLLGGKRT